MRAASSQCIRTAVERDAPEVAAIYAPVVRGSATTFEYEPPSAAEVAARIRTLSAQWPWLVLERDAAVAGYAYASAWRARAAYQWVVETTVYVRPDVHRQGVGRALYRSLLACLRLLGHRLAIGAITLPNAPSVALHESLGFRLAVVHRACGHKLGAWHDVGVWELELAPRTDAVPAPPLRPGAVAHPAWARALATGLGG
jgi:L-amino acid N-acyltransferase YncA